jgi:hypothetical protein
VVEFSLRSGKARLRWGRWAATSLRRFFPTPEPRIERSNGEQRGFLRDSLAGVAGVGEVPLVAAANSIDG